MTDAPLFRETDTCRDGLLTSTARTAILVVYIGLCFVSTVVFFVGAGRDALCLVDGFHAIVTEVTLLNEFNAMRFSHA